MPVGSCGVDSNHDRKIGRLEEEADVIGIPGEELEGDPEVHPGWEKKVSDSTIPTRGGRARSRVIKGGQEKWRRPVLIVAAICPYRLKS
jgi:hypothetical protein